MSNNLHEQVIQVLIKHRGRDKAIKGMEIARLLGFRDDRQVRLVIRELITEGYPIASSVQPPFGYFMIVNQAEAQEYQEGLKGRLINDALRLRDFKRSAGRRLEKVIQGKLI